MLALMRCTSCVLFLQVPAVQQVVLMLLMLLSELLQVPDMGRVGLGCWTAELRRCSRCPAATSAIPTARLYYHCSKHARTATLVLYI
jgi:hypothetical protein